MENSQILQFFNVEQRDKLHVKHQFDPLLLRPFGSWLQLIQGESWRRLPAPFAVRQREQE